MKGFVKHHYLTFCGFILLLISLGLPYFLGPEEIGLVDLIPDLNNKQNSETALLATFLLVSLNTLILLPLYLGSFIIGEQCMKRLRSHRFSEWIPLILIALIHMALHMSVSWYTSLTTSTAMIIIVFLFMQKVHLHLKLKLFILSQTIFAVQWLDAIPCLVNYGFGNSFYAIQLMNKITTFGLQNTITIYATLIFGILLLNIFIISSLAIYYFQKNSTSQQIHQAQLEASSADRGVEVLHLVHDIKTPLTTIGGLVSLINLKTDDKQIDEYCTKIQDSIQKLEDMVSEILNENKKNWYTVQELFDYIRASYISKSQFQINVAIPSEDVYLWINKIRLSRALANLIDNAIDAIEAVDHGQVTLRAVEKGNRIYIGVTDNGVGMDEEQRQKIWEAGFSTKNHSGIGLSFVQQVANHHDAIIQIETALHNGTTIWFIFEKGEE